MWVQLIGHFGPAQPIQSRCKKHETCINGPERNNQGEVHFALCIDRNAFVELTLDITGGRGKGLPLGDQDANVFQQQGGASQGSSGRGNGENDFQQQGGSSKGSGGAAVNNLQLGGMMMSAVASKADGNSPLNMQTLDVEAGVLGEDGTGLVGADGTVLQEQRCENCVDLEMRQFSKGTEALRTEATVLSAGTGGGVLWMALLAG